MKTGNALLLLGGAAAAYLWWRKGHMEAQAQIQSLAAVSAPPPGPVIQIPVTPPAVVQTAQGAVYIPAAPVVDSDTNTAQQLQLLKWAQTTPNPNLYAQMVNDLSPQNLAGLYDVLINAWYAGVSPTAAETAFWNNLRVAYPFLNTQGKGCNNFQCN